MKASLTGKAHLVLGLILALLIAGLAARSGEVMLLALPFIFYLALGLLNAPGDVRLEARRETEGRRWEADHPVTMRVTVENRGGEIACLKLTDERHPGMDVEDGWQARGAALPDDGRLELAYTLRAGRGRYDWRWVYAAAGDPLGLFERTLRLPAPGTVYLLPSQPAIKGLRAAVGHTRPTAGPHLSRRVGVGNDFFGVREYTPGDSLRRIAWRMSARHPGEFYSKEFEREEMADVGVLLDARILTNVRRGEDCLLDASIQAAAALAKSFLNAGDRVSLLILGKPVVRIFPGTGKRQLLSIQEALAGCQPGENISFETIKYLPVRLFPSRSLLVVVSPLRKEDLTPLSRLKAEGYEVLLVSPDPVAFSTGGVKEEPAARLGMRAAQLERQALLWRLRRQGLRVVDWRVEEPLAAAVRAAGGARPTSARGRNL